MNTKQIVALATFISMVAVPAFGGRGIVMENGIVRNFIDKNSPNFVGKKELAKKEDSETPSEDKTEDTRNFKTKVVDLFKSEDGSWNTTRLTGLALSTVAVAGLGYAAWTGNLNKEGLGKAKDALTGAYEACTMENLKKLNPFAKKAE